jgi:hypothetical protein
MSIKRACISGLLEAEDILWQALDKDLVDNFRFFLIRYSQQLSIELNIATTKLINVALYSSERCFLLTSDFCSANYSANLKL